MADSQSTEGNTSSSSRGPNPRKPKRGYSDRNARKAKAQINKDAPPVPLDSKFLGFTSVQRGNAHVKINHNVTEIIGKDYRDTISAGQANKGFFDNAGNPLDLDYLSRGLTGGLCLSLALKMIQATPSSQVPQIATFRSFKEFQIQVPRSFIQIVDLVGKTDYQDWIIRIAENQLTIKRFLLKCLKYFKQNADFVADYVFLNNNDNNAFNGLDALTPLDFRNIYFADEDSVKSIKQRAKDWLSNQLSQDFPINIGGNNIRFGYPPLPQDQTVQNILDWLAKFVANVHPNFNNIILTGVLLLVDLRWLENPATQLQNLDPIFANTAVAANTPVQLLNACGLHHYTEYLSQRNFIELSRSSFTYYEVKITQRLKSLLTMVTQASSTLGSPAQLVLTPEDLKTTYADNGLNRIDIDRNLNHCISYVKLDISAQVTKSAMTNLVEDVDLNPDYEGHFATSLYSIRKQFLSQDGLLYSQQRLYS